MPPPESITVYEPVWRCIYCGSDSPPLGKEHIVPFGLGGTFVLPRASCQICTAITGQVEGWCLQVMFGALRYQKNMPTRRPGQRPSHIPVRLRYKDGQSDIINTPPNQLPPVLSGFLLPEPGILRGASPTNTFKPGHWLITTDQWNQLGEDRTRTIQIGSCNLYRFSRMVAKIAHSFAVATCGLDSFRPLLIDLILGRTNYATYLIGGTLQAPDPIPGASYRLDLFNYSVNETNYLMARVHLFANGGAPFYTVVVGETEGKIAPDGVLN